MAPAAENRRLPIRVILLRPEDPRNVGAVVRAAANFRAEGVHVVGVPEWSADHEREARIASSGAWESVGGVHLWPTLSEAGSDCTVLAGTTARNRAGTIEVLTPSAFLALQEHENGLIGMVFGPESQGFSSQDMAECHACIRIPVAGEFPSLNLAQAVLIVLYEGWKHLAASRHDPDLPHAQQPARVASQEAVLGRLHDVLGSSPAARQAVTQIRRLLQRARPTEADIAALARLGRAMEVGLAGARSPGDSRSNRQRFRRWR